MGSLPVNSHRRVMEKLLWPAFAKSSGISALARRSIRGEPNVKAPCRFGVSIRATDDRILYPFSSMVAGTHN